MNLPQPFDEFLFVPRLESHLNDFIKCPSALPKVICFHGYPGTGKTTFAKAFAKAYGENYFYYPMNETKIDSKFVKSLNMSSANSLMSFMEPEDKPFTQVTILDEFHNLNPKSQDFFKTQLDALGERDHVIICLNTTDTKDLRKSVTEPIYSRLIEQIDFNISRAEYPSFASKIAKQFPYLELHEIKAYLPDMRKIFGLNEMRMKLNRYNHQ
jgi:predicted AAA+ superfamily ATPase